MLSALLSVSINFSLILIEPIKFIRNLLPIFDFSLDCEIILNPFPDYARKQVRFFLGPVVCGQRDFFYA